MFSKLAYFRTCPNWAKGSEEEDSSIQGTAREETVNLSLGSYYGNLAIDSYKEDGKNSIM